MIISAFNRCAINACLAAAMLAGCGSQPPIGEPGAMPQISALTMHGEHAKSWMLTEAKSEDLLYVANFSTVNILSYPAGKLVGELKGFSANASECVDAKNNVCVTNFDPPALYEYAHGGTKRIATFRLKQHGAVGCSYDKTTGDLAVIGVGSTVDIFPPGITKPKTILSSKLFFDGGCTFDSSGDLFIDGLKTPTGPAALVVLPTGSRKFSTVSVDATFDDESVLACDGKHLDIISYLPGKKNKPAIYLFAISGTKANKVGMARLLKADLVYQFSLYRDAAIVSSGNLKTSQRSVFFYQYVQGGKPTAQLTKNVNDARGVVVSPAS
jgi:hypothetical protein